MNKTTDQVVYFIILAILFVVDAVKTLLTIRTKGIFIDQRKLLLQKTNKELKTMLQGVKRISGLKKKDLVELVIQYS